MRLAISPSSSSSSSSISNRAFISRILRRFVNFYRHKKRKKTRQLCHSTSNTYFNFERVNRGRNGPTLTHDNTHIGVNVSHQSATLDTSKFLFLLFRPTLPSIMMSYCLTPFFFYQLRKMDQRGCIYAEPPTFLANPPDRAIGWPNNEGAFQQVFHCLIIAAALGYLLLTA